MLSRMSVTAAAPESVLDAPAPALRSPIQGPVRAFSQLRSRLPADPALAWIATLVITTIAAVIRLWGIGFPDRATYGYAFDETYYATEGREILNNGGYENNPGYMFIVHPPMGKWFIAAGEWLFTDRFHWPQEYGYRIPSAIAGTLAVLILIRVARRMTGSTLLGCTAGLLLTVDGLSVVQSRTALLDIFLQTLVIGAFACLVVDRDKMRERLARGAPWMAYSSAAGPPLPPRPWRLTAGLLIGLACGVKWSAVYFGVGFFILSVLWDRAARRSAGVRKPTRGTLVRDLPASIAAMLIVPALTYFATWTGWLLGENGYNRHWGDTHPASWASMNPLDLWGGQPGLHLRLEPSRWALLPGAFRSLFQYHGTALHFHNTLSSPHPYQSSPWSWLVLGRPVSFYYPGGDQTPRGCGAPSCVREILDIGTPALWWAFVPALLWMGWLLITRRDWRAGAVLMAFAAGWGTWMINLDRTMFLFYMVPLVPFLVLGVTLMLGDGLGSAWASESRRLWGQVAFCGYLGLVVANFIWLHPLLIGSLMTYDEWHARIWFPSWV
jgi:dolichyl-phosphate-mannose-protein mannosyltransferase